MRKLKKEVKYDPLHDGPYMAFEVRLYAKSSFMAREYESVIWRFGLTPEQAIKLKLIYPLDGE